MPIQSAPARRVLKILTYTSLFPNSVQPLLGSFVLERMRHLRQSVELSIVAPVPYFPRLDFNKRWYQFASIPAAENICDLPVSHPRFVLLPKISMQAHGISMFLGSVSRVRELVGTTGCDLIDAHYVYPDGLAAVMLGAKFKKPVVVSARGSDINRFRCFKTIRPLIQYVLCKADAIIAVSPGLRDGMIDLGCPPEKITVIPNGVDSVKFSQNPRMAMREQLGLPLNRPIALSVGRLDENKGIDFLVEAMAHLRSGERRWLLVIVGEGVRRKKLQIQIRDLKLDDYVRLVGTQPHSELPKWYSAADYFCLASSREGWPNVVMEAMACGLPVIASDAWGASEILTSDSLGMIVKRDPAAFAHALNEATHREWDRDRIVEYARSHTWEKVAQKVLHVYDEAVSRYHNRQDSH